MKNALENHPYIQSIIDLNEKHTNRHLFHKNCNALLLKMGQDKSFLNLLIQRNLLDEGFLNQQWSLYHIPYLLIYENADFNLKIHLFTPLEKKESAIAASCIHHHNNYLLSSFAFHGSGYESIIFNKDFSYNIAQNEAKFSIAKHFHQKDWPISFVDAWEPHLVFNPENLSATLILWTPDKKRKTDLLRQNRILKFFKKPLRKIINLLGLAQSAGIANSQTYQFYPEDYKIRGILEDEFFAPTRKAVGADVDEYSVQTIFKFIQEGSYLEKQWVKNNIEKWPLVYQKFANMYLNNEPIPAIFAKSSINIPQKSFNKTDVLTAIKNA